MFIELIVTSTINCIEWQLTKNFISLNTLALEILHVTTLCCIPGLKLALHYWPGWPDSVSTLVYTKWIYIWVHKCSQYYVIYMHHTQFILCVVYWLQYKFSDNVTTVYYIQNSYNQEMLRLHTLAFWVLFLHGGMFA